MSNNEDDDDEYLYGPIEHSSNPTEAGQPAEATEAIVPEPTPLQISELSNSSLPPVEIPGMSSHGSSEPSQPPPDAPSSAEGEQDASGWDAQENGNGDEDANEDIEEEESEDDIEFIMEPTARSLDLRQNRSLRTSPSTLHGQAIPQPSLTTEYTPMQRAGLMSPTTSTSQQPTTASSVSHAQNIPDTQDKIDTSKLPPVTAPPSHPSIDPDIVGTLDGRSILEVDLAAMSDKQWRRPGADISDWFNYGFDEISWEAYCYRRRELGDLAAVMKTNVINFAGMQEDQLQGLPPDARQMVMTGVNTMLNTSGAMMNAAANPAMMNAASSAQMLGPGVMMDMGMMPMGMGMNGEMGMNGSMMSGLMPQEGASSGAGPVDQGAGGMMSDAYGPPGMMMNMGMGGEYDMQEQQNQLAKSMSGGQPMNPQMGQPMGQPIGQPIGQPMQQMGQQMSQQMGQQMNQQMGQQPSMVNQMGQTMTPGQSMNQQNQQIYSQSVEATPPTQPAAARGGTQATFRGRGQRGGRAVFPVRGRGRGGIYGSEAVPVVPLRSTSPLPPNVPTGPRSQNKYKDRDNNGPAVDGLDYGGGKDISRISSREPDDRISRDDRMRDRDVHDRGRDDRGRDDRGRDDRGRDDRGRDDRSNRKRRNVSPFDDLRSSKRR